MKIAIRVDSSLLVGSGHLMRCLTLAEKIKSKINAEIIFISRDLEKNINYMVEKQGFELHILPKIEINNKLIGYEQWLTVTQQEDAEEVKEILQKQQVDLIIIDSYAIDYNWENIVRPCVKKIMIIDDLANRKHDCEILLDQNYYKNMHLRYENLLPVYCKKLLGPQNTILRKEFVQEKIKMRNINNLEVKRILVSFGGSDPSNETLKSMIALRNIERQNIKVDVVVGGSNNNKECIEKFCKENKNFFIHYQIDYMAKLMSLADISIGAGGITTLERCYMMLPSIVISLAENQNEICENFAEIGYIEYLGYYEDVGVEDIEKSLNKYILHPELLENFRKNIKDFVQDIDVKNIIS